MARALWQEFWIHFILNHAELPLFSNSESPADEIECPGFTPFTHPSFQSSPKSLLNKLTPDLLALFTPDNSEICIDTLLRCLALSRFVYQPDSLQVAAFHLNIGCAYLELKHSPAQAIKHIRTAMEIIDPHRLSSETNDNFSAVLLNIRACLLYAKSLLLQQKPYESLNFLKQAKSDSKLIQTLNPNFRDTKHIVFIHYIKGQVLKSTFKYKLALATFRESLDGVANIFGAKDQHVVMVLMEIVEVLGELGMYDNAMGYAVKCYELCEGFGHLKADSALVLAKLHFAAKTKEGFENSVKYYDEWAERVDIEKAQKSDLYFERLVANFEQYILVLSKVGNQSKTYEILTRLIHICTERFGEMSREVANLCRQLGLCYLTEGKIKKAVEQLEKGRDAFDFSLGKQNKESKNIDQILGRVDPIHKYQVATPQQEKARFKTIV